MRNATIVSLFMLCSLIAFGQDEPQWRVIKHVFLTQQTQRISPTTLVTPSEPGVYRINLYFTGGGGGKGEQSYFQAQILGTDLSGESLNSSATVFCGFKALSLMSPFVVSLKPNLSLRYLVSAVLPPTAGCQYNLAITVEQLVQ